MVHIEKINQISYTPDGEALAWYDLSVSTAAELPALNSVVFGAKIQAPSRAQIIQADEPTIVTLDENGTWYPEQSGSSKNSLNASLSMSPTLNKAITDSKDDMIELTEDDIDRISDELEQAETPVKEQKKVFEESIEEPEKDGEDDDELL